MTSLLLREHVKHRKEAARCTSQLTVPPLPEELPKHPKKLSWNMHMADDNNIPEQIELVGVALQVL